MMHPAFRMLIALISIWSVVLCGVDKAYPAHGDRTKGDGKPKVLDANDSVVGNVVGVIDLYQGESGVPKFAAVALNLSGLSVILGVSTQALRGTAELYYEDQNCSGQPFFSAGEISNSLEFSYLLPTVAVANGILYAPRANSAPVPVTTASKFTILWNRCRQSDREISQGIIADPIVNLNTQFVPPFRFVAP